MISGMSRTVAKQVACPWRLTGRQRIWAAIAVYSAVYMSWMIIRWGPLDRKLTGDLFQIFMNGSMAVLCVGAARRSAAISSLRWAWGLIAAGVLMYTLGNITQFVYEAVLKELPYPSVADVVYLMTYPLMFAGLLCFPTRRASGVQRMQLGLGAAVLAIGGATVVWYVELGPTVVQASSQPLLPTIFSILYPVGDLIVIAALAGVLTRGTLPSSKRSLGIFSIGCLVFVTADLLLGYITVKLNQTYSGGDWLDPVWFLGLALWGVAATLQDPAKPEELAQLDDRTHVVRRRPSWMPYAAVAVAFALLVVAERHDRFYPAFSLVIANLVLVALVTVRQLAAQSELISVQRDLQGAHHELAALATTDALTGLPNHRELVVAIDRELELTTRHGQQFALAFLDLDHFKAINDTLGHAAGDAVLKETSDVLRECLRGGDIAGRWGGEEFIVVLPQTDSPGAMIAAERLRATIAQHRFQAAGGAHLTCSIGVAVRPFDGTDRDALIESADRAMYAAKRLGRNQVIAARDQAALAVGTHDASSNREEQALLGAVEALGGIVDARDRYTGAHSASVAVLCNRVALLLGCETSQVHLIGLAARLHDIGKVAVPDAILNKPGRLTEEEWSVMQTHPAVGAEIAGRIPRLRAAMPLIRGHHERVDGGGYPDGLVGEAIPLGARIIAVADAFSAMITDRPYSDARTEIAALQELHRCAGTQFDPHVVEALERVIAHGEQRLRAA
jgi:two-component system, cell cycle response regulator